MYYKAEASKEHDWNYDAESKVFEKKQARASAKKNKAAGAAVGVLAGDVREEVNEAEDDDPEEARERSARDPETGWREYLPERARRLYAWWRIHHDTKGMEYFAAAVRELVLCQVSSADMERVFSLFLRVLTKVGNAALMDNIVTRVTMMHRREHKYSKPN